MQKEIVIIQEIHPPTNGISEYNKLEKLFRKYGFTSLKWNITSSRIRDCNDVCEFWKK